MSRSESSPRGRPAPYTWPEVGRSSPPMSESRVLFPQPDGPTIATNSPGPTSIVTLRSAVTCISSRPPNSRETASRRRPTAWPRRSRNSSGCGGAAGPCWGGGGSVSTAGAGGSATVTRAVAAWCGAPFSSSELPLLPLWVWAAAYRRSRARRRRRLEPPDSPGPVTTVATPALLFPRSLSVDARLTSRSVAGFGYLPLEPVQVSRRPSLDRDLQDLREHVFVVGSDVFLHGGRTRLQGLDQQERFVLPLQLIVLVIEGADRRHDRAAGCEMLDDERLAQPLRIVACAGGDHDQDGFLPHPVNCQLSAAGQARRCPLPTRSHPGSNRRRRRIPNARPGRGDRSRRARSPRLLAQQRSRGCAATPRGDGSRRRAVHSRSPPGARGRWESCCRHLCPKRASRCSDHQTPPAIAAAAGDKDSTCNTARTPGRRRRQ